MPSDPDPAEPPPDFDPAASGRDFDAASFFAAYRRALWPTPHAVVLAARNTTVICRSWADVPTHRRPAPCSTTCR